MKYTTTAKATTATTMATAGSIEMVALLETGRVICSVVTEEYLAFGVFRPVF